MDNIEELTAKRNAFSADKGSTLLSFLNQANEDISVINQLIGQYNRKKTKLEKQVILNKIEKKNQLILNKYPSSFLAASADFSEQIHNKLFNSIKKERAKLKGYVINSLPTINEDMESEWDTSSIQANTSLPGIIENMSPEKVSRLMEILSKGSQFNRNDVYDLYSDTDDGYDNFQAFLDSITDIKFLRGENSKNFQITRPNGNSLILKLENRLDQPALIEEQLQSGILKNVLIPIKAKRNGTFTHEGTYDIKASPVAPTFPIKNRLYLTITHDSVEYMYVDDNNKSQKDTLNLAGISYQNFKSYLPDILKITDQRGHTRPVNRTINRSLAVTEVCRGGDLQYHGEVIKDPLKKIESALNIYAQMGHILAGFMQNHCAFPDMKNTNWLMDDKGTLKIADTKSFIYINDNGNLDQSIPQNKWYENGIIRSDYISPPEIITPCDDDLFSADRMHVYMLGKNLYQYLTGCTCDDLAQNKVVFKPFDVFKTAEGKQLQKLIKSMVKANSNDRISTVDALEKLKEIQKNMIQKAAEKAAMAKEAQALELAIKNKREDCKALLTEILTLKFGEHDTHMVNFYFKQSSQIRRADNFVDLDRIYTHLTSILDNKNSILQLGTYLRTFRNPAASLLGLNSTYGLLKKAMLAVPVEERGNINKKDMVQNKEVKEMQTLLSKYADPAWLKKFYAPYEQKNAVNASRSYRAKFQEANQIEDVLNPMMKKTSE